MRMNKESELSAYEIVNEYSEDKLFKVIRDYGEEKFAKNIAKDGTTVGLVRVFFDRLLFKCHLKRADGQFNIVTFHGYHRCLYRVTNMELGCILFGFFTRQIGTADCTFNIIRQIQNQFVGCDCGNRPRQNRTFLDRCRVVVRARRQLFNTQCDAFFFWIDVQDFRRHFLATNEFFQFFFVKAIPRQVGNVNHTVQFRCQRHKQPKFGCILNRPSDNIADIVCFGKLLPRVWLQLFIPQ